MSAAPRSLLELIPAKGLSGGYGTGDSFSFLRQTVRTNNAALSLTGLEANVGVLAHRS
ncbi:hypothetical protein [Pseudarthrobacter sp. NIBRBAC000502770]|uniref:hypothetical protein n=1 Tax=Pseudarthrobacter sp. NIBRBAC000502770 TaxID=2590785 RepID=UPI00143D7381|nr:hypothetical protein [Pseudarthrobacter sp. NIBRBAC000502770]